MLFLHLNTGGIMAFFQDLRTSFPKVDIIWNATLICPWDCKNCCVDAVHVAPHGSSVSIRSNSLEKHEVIHRYSANRASPFEIAAKHRQSQGLELTYEEKLKILENLEGFDPKIDFSGGDVLILEENLEVMRIAAERFGKQRITLTSTGAALSRYTPEQVAPYIGELNFTYDSSSLHKNTHRPDGYARGNLQKASQFAASGVQVRAECPLSVHNISDANLRQLYLDLHEAQIQKLLLMRLFPVGRGLLVAEDIPSENQYKRAVNVLREMEAQLGFPKLKLQCALRHFDDPFASRNPCDMVSESFGLMADGTLLASPWAINSNGKPLDDVWILGNLAEESLKTILASEKVKQIKSRLSENFGHCKIQAFMNSNRSNPLDRMFDTSDPLYERLEVQPTRPVAA